MEKKLAVYICTGQGIGDVLDVEQLQKVATEEYKVPICRTHPSLGGPEIREFIQKDIDSEGVNALIVAGTSPRAMHDVFDFENCLVERVNLREQVIWCTEPNDSLENKYEDIQMMAEDYLRMSLAKIQKMELPTPYQPQEEISKDIMVVGGGVTGLTAALETAKAGYKVILVEKEDQLGGFQKKVSHKVTFPFKGVVDNNVDQLIKEVEEHDKITIYTGATVEETVGGPCLFNITLKQGEPKEGEEAPEPIKFRVGSIVMSPGWVPYDPTKLDASLGYGQSPKVVTNVEFEEQNKAQAKLDNVVFLQCAGSRDPKHLPYCSSICCLASLKQAVMIKENNPEANVFIVFKELRTPGQAEDFYRKAQETGVIFIRSQDPKVLTNGSLRVEAFDEVLNDTVEIPDLDLVVLATGMVPTTKLGIDVKAKPVDEAKKADAEAAKAAKAEAAAKAKEAEEKKEKKEKKKKKGKKGKKAAAGPAAAESVPLPPPPADVIYASNTLNLAYRQGPELPDLAYGFPDSHFVCFPFESRRTGIYPAGCVRRPMGTATAFEDAAGAAMKAIQCVEAVSQGKALHPRSGDTSFPEIYLSRCTQCRRCTDECPFGALNEDEKGNPLPHPTRCRRCGVCMGACPERIISFKNYSVDIIGSMVKSVSMPEADEEKPRILVFACENDAYPALDMAGMKGVKTSPYIRVIPLRCLGSLNLVWIADALASGFDGVILFGCKYGDDYQCHFIRGSELASIRMSKISETLTRLGLESERVLVEEINITDWERAPQIINKFVDHIVEIGANPFKDL